MSSTGLAASLRFQHKSNLQKAKRMSTSAQTPKGKMLFNISAGGNQVHPHPKGMASPKPQGQRRGSLLSKGLNQQPDHPRLQKTSTNIQVDAGDSGKPPRRNSHNNAEPGTSHAQAQQPDFLRAGTGTGPGAGAGKGQGLGSNESSQNTSPRGSPNRGQHGRGKLNGDGIGGKMGEAAGTIEMRHMPPEGGSHHRSMSLSSPNHRHRKSSGSITSSQLPLIGGSPKHIIDSAHQKHQTHINNLNALQNMNLLNTANPMESPRQSINSSLASNNNIMGISEDEGPEDTWKQRVLTENNLSFHTIGAPLSDDELEKNNKWIIHPHSRGRVVWDFLVLFLLFYNLVEIPYRVCFESEPEKNSLADILNLSVDMMFILDIIVNFSTGLMLDGFYETDRTLICKNYMSSYFFLDFITSVPFGRIVFLFAQEGDSSESLARLPRLLRIFRIVRLLKVLRLFKLLKMMRQWEEENMNMTRVIRLFKLVFLNAFFAHLAGCMWYFISNSQEGQTWLDTIPDPDDITSIYLTSVYWAFQTLTTVGYGDVQPYTDDEKLFATMTMFIGACIFAYIVGNISNLISKEDQTSVLVRNKMGSIQAYMRYRKLPTDLKNRIRAHYEYCWRRTTIYDERGILEELPPFLRTEVALFLHKDVLVGVPFFRDLEDNLMAQLVIHLRPIQVAPGQFVYRQGSTGRNMFIISKGKVEVIIEELPVCILYDGAFFGEYALIPDATPHRDASMRAKTFCDLFSLSKRDFERSIKHEYPAMWQQIVVRAETMAADQDRLLQEEYMQHAMLGSMSKSKSKSSVTRSNTLTEVGTSGRVNKISIVNEFGRSNTYGKDSRGSFLKMSLNGAGKRGSGNGGMFGHLLNDTSVANSMGSNANTNANYNINPLAPKTSASDNMDNTNSNNDNDSKNNATGSSSSSTSATNKNGQNGTGFSLNKLDVSNKNTSDGDDRILSVPGSPMGPVDDDLTEFGNQQFREFDVSPLAGAKSKLGGGHRDDNRDTVHALNRHDSGDTSKGKRKKNTFKIKQRSKGDESDGSTASEGSIHSDLDASQLHRQLSAHKSKDPSATPRGGARCSKDSDKGRDGDAPLKRYPEMYSNHNSQIDSPTMPHMTLYDQEKEGLDKDGGDKEDADHGRFFAVAPPSPHAKTVIGRAPLNGSKSTDSKPKRRNSFDGCNNGGGGGGKKKSRDRDRDRERERERDRDRDDDRKQVAKRSSFSRRGFGGSATDAASDADDDLNSSTRGREGRNSRIKRIGGDDNRRRGKMLSGRSKNQSGGGSAGSSGGGNNADLMDYLVRIERRLTQKMDDLGAKIDKVVAQFRVSQLDEMKKNGKSGESSIDDRRKSSHAAIMRKRSDTISGKKISRGRSGERRAGSVANSGGGQGVDPSRPSLSRGDTVKNLLRRDKSAEGSTGEGEKGDKEKGEAEGSGKKRSKKMGRLTKFMSFVKKDTKDSPGDEDE